MQKSIVTLAALTLFGTSAYAAPIPANNWTLDLNAAVTGLGTTTKIDRVIVSGSSTLTQSFGSDHVFNDGDKFTEMSLLQSLTYWQEPGSGLGNYKSFDLTDSNGDAWNLYLYGTGLTGSVYDVSSPDPTTASFKYKFDAGVGSLGIYLDKDLDPTNAGTISLATFSIIDPSGGLGPAGFLGGQGPNGTTDITGLFTSAFPGVWKTDIGYDFGSTALALLNTHNSVVGFAPTRDGFTAEIESSGQLNVVTPEPGTFALLGAGLVGLGIFSRRRSSRS